MKVIIQKIDYLLDDNYKSFTNIIEKEYNDLYNQLKDFLQNFIKCIFGGQIVKVEDDETSLIINKNNNYYKIKLNFSEKLNLTEKKISYKNMLLDAFDERNIDNIYKYFNLLNIKANNLTQDIKSLLIKLKENEKFETKYLKTVKKKINSFYLIKNKPNKVSKINLLKNKRTLLLYKYFLEKAENINEIRKIYKFFK